MHPPSWVCNALARQRSDIRLAWAGRIPTEKEIEAGDDLNNGDFALVQLYPASVVGPLSDPWIFSELWGVSPRLNEAGAVEMKKIDRGPIFAKDGSTVPDWDPITQIPVYVVNLGGLGFDKYRVCNGEFLPLLPRWSRTAKARMKESLQQQYKDHKSEVDSMARDATDYWWHLANKSGETAPIVPWKFAKKDVSDMYEKREHRKLESYYKL